jgi:hypothetical protein
MYTKTNRQPSPNIPSQGVNVIDAYIRRLSLIFCETITFFSFFAWFYRKNISLNHNIGPKWNVGFKSILIRFIFGHRSTQQISFHCMPQSICMHTYLYVGITFSQLICMYVCTCLCGYYVFTNSDALLASYFHTDEALQECKYLPVDSSFDNET